MREVTLTDTGPVRFDEDDLHDEYGDIAVCRCGLSEEFPLCDGSHEATEDEAEGVRYKYVDGERRVVERLEYADEDAVGGSDGVPAEGDGRDGDGRDDGD
ncbi:CDGSH iron-sulfur domain-containing protein [Halobaculum lipolyticum]|uniref:CDGSH iron-sulfur domain-containing protein n=1 Tax=Halobaculum lipolyticum TaxID=3032001 RepID=A0ABD5WCJ4_9EURY|nr:CDGSH iron-sulfur domain-containing protein [Halobaculum sp. DT31]